MSSESLNSLFSRLLQSIFGPTQVAFDLTTQELREAEKQVLWTAEGTESALVSVAKPWTSDLLFENV
jgi:hypothetical protein